MMVETEAKLSSPLLSVFVHGGRGSLGGWAW